MGKYNPRNATRADFDYLFEHVPELVSGMETVNGTIARILADMVGKYDPLDEEVMEARSGYASLDDRLDAMSGGGGSTDYEELDNKPQINGVTLDGDTSLEDIGAASTAQIAALSGIVDSGTKNMIKNGSGTGTQWYDISLTIPAGKYVLYFGNLESTDTDAETCQVCAFSSSNQAVSSYLQYNRGAGKSKLITITAEAAFIRVYASKNTASGSGDTVSFESAMLCTEDAWNASTAYVPYKETADDMIMNPTGDTTDRTTEILKMLTDHGECKLAEGTYYVSGFEMPTGSKLYGSGERTVIKLLPSISNGYCIRIHRYNIVSGIKFSGGDESPENLFVEGASFGNRHGIYLAANADGEGETHSGSLVNIVHDCMFEYFDGGGFVAENTGTGLFAGVLMRNCVFRQCMVGIYIRYYSEYSKFEGCITYQCNVAAINNGGNNVFTNCTFHGVKGFVIDNSNGDMTNCAHGSCVACTFNHMDNMNRPSTLGGGKGIEIKGVRNGFVFDGCQIWYSAISIDDSRGIIITDSFLAGGTPSIAVTGSYGAYFMACMFQKQPNVSANSATRFEDCFVDDTGERVQPDPVLVGMVDGGDKNILNATAQTQTVDTVSLTRNADGSYTVQTSAATTSQVAITLGTANLAAGEQYTISGISGGSNSTFFLNYDHALADGTSNKNVYESGLDLAVGSADRTSTVKLYIRSGQTVNITLKPMICKKELWKISRAFVPHRPSWDEMWAAIQALQ